MAKSKNSKDQKRRSRNRTLKIKEAQKLFEKRQKEMFLKFIEEQKNSQVAGQIDPNQIPQINTEGPII